MTGMNFAGVDYWAIVIAAMAGYAVGAVWYWAWGKPWMAAVGFGADKGEHKDKQSQSPLPLVIAFVADIVMAAVLAGVVGHLGVGYVTLTNGVISGALIWLGFVFTTMVVNYGFARRPPILLLIDGGHWLVVLMLMGAIIGGLGVK